MAIALGISRPVGKAKTNNPSSKNEEKLSSDIKQQVFDKDNNTCQYCGFTSKKYQDVAFKDSNKNNKNLDNLSTACIFCHQCMNLEIVSDMRSGILTWLPEIKQETLNHIARSIYVARISQGPIADAARKSLDILMGRREEVKNRLGTDEPHILADVLRDYLGDKHYYHRQKKLEGIRLLPLDRRIIKEAELEFNQFPQILAYWRSKDGPFGGKTPPQWIALYKGILEQGR